jgi:hypothetical protein
MDSMFWMFGGLYLAGLEALFCATFAWARWHDPGLASGSGFWIAGIATLALGICGLAFEVVGFFWSPERKFSRHFFHAMLCVGLAAVVVRGIGPFGQAALMRLAMTGSL